MTETIDTANLRALAENIIAADGPIWWIEQDFRAVKEVLDATIDDARFVAAANPTTILALLDRLAAAEARNATLTDDAALGQIAMKFVDRFGADRPWVDDAEALCSEFHAAMRAALDKPEGSAC